MDLDGDARPDTALLTAIGARADSLEISLDLVIDGEVRHREQWQSGYELIDVDSNYRVSPGLDRYIRDRLDSALASVKVEPLDTATITLLGEDPDVHKRIVPRPTNQISLSYGYETAMALVWDATARRLIRLWYCC